MTEVRGLIDRAGKISAIGDTITGRTFRILPERTTKGTRVLTATTHEVSVSAIVIEPADQLEIAALHIKSGRLEPLAKGHWHRVVTE